MNKKLIIIIVIALVFVGFVVIGNIAYNLTDGANEIKTTNEVKETKETNNVQIKDFNNVKVKKKKSKNSKTTKEVKKVNDSNIIVDEKITTFSSKLSSDEIKELEDKLREIYDKEIITREHPNKDFFSNDFLNHLN